MAVYRLTHVAQADIASILLRSYEQFGEEARKRYEALIATAIRDAASLGEDRGLIPRPELSPGRLLLASLAQSFPNSRRQSQSSTPFPHLST